MIANINQKVTHAYGDEYDRIFGKKEADYYQKEAGAYVWDPITKKLLKSDSVNAMKDVEPMLDKVRRMDPITITRKPGC